jgi:hypothetical protein
MGLHTAEVTATDRALVRLRKSEGNRAPLRP